MAQDSDGGPLDVDRRMTLKGLLATGVGATLFGSAEAETEEAEQLPDRRGPYRNHRFMVEIDGIATVGFETAKLPESITEEVEYREGTDRNTSRKLAGTNRHNTLVLKKGVTDDSIELFEWFQQVQQGSVDEARRPIAVIVLDEEGEPGPRWEFSDAWPARYDAPDLEATGNEVAIETIEIVHEGMERTA